MHSKHFLRPAIATAMLLMIPVIGMQVSTEWNWTAFDFVFMGVLIFGCCFAFEMVARLSSDATYRAGVGLGCLTLFLLLWVNGATGLIGGEDSPLNMLFLGVPLAGLIGAAIARLKPQGLSNTLFAMAVLTVAIPAVGLFIIKPLLPPDAAGITTLLRTFGASGFFAMLFAFAGVLFRNAPQPKIAV